MMFGLAMVGGIIVLGLVANYCKGKSDKDYGEYLVELSEVKRRKRERNGT